jgi:UDP-N-acetylglucosamine--N-acetylmuramyl-(pentapeptide) pyrophosphoryl-undecaprenol N-acetylglucosamine transferase
MKSIVLTGGGSAGHVTPNIALLPRLQALHLDIHYIGQQAAIERDLIAPLYIPYHAISAGKLRRYLDLKNLTDIFRVGWGFLQAFAILRKLQPDVVFSKGGFVSCPVVWAAWLLRIPVVIHESDLTPGLANKLSAPFATRICYSFPETAAHLSGEKAICTGIPIRDVLRSGNPDKGRKLCHFSDQKPVLLIIGGSLGAQAINEAVRAAFSTLQQDFNICHLCGAGHLDSAFENISGYAQFEYVFEELPHLFALADVVVSRAGATTLFELLALQKPNLLIPLPLTSSRGDQILNARSFELQGFSIVLPEEQLTPETLISEVHKTYARCDQMAQSMQKADGADGVDRVLEVIQQYART